MRGLESLIPQKRDNNNSISPKESVFLIDVEKIHPNPYQPRREFKEGELSDLASSIRQYGILQPLIVTKKNIERPDGRDVEYELIAGERRLRAAKLANIPRVPVVVRNNPTSPEKLAISLIENIQRENLNPIEEARAYEKLHKEFGMSHEEIAKEIGKGRVVVTNAIRILKLPENMQKAVFDGSIPMANSRYLLTLNDNPELQNKLFREMTTRGLDTHRAQERLWELQKESGVPQARTASSSRDAELLALAEQIKDFLGLNGVKIQRLGRRAKISIEFPSKSHLIDWTKKFL